MGSVVEIDGSFLEGGGQILRVAVALSVLMKTPIHITRIRAGRPKPGLRPQHVKGLEVVQNLCNAKMRGGVPDSMEVTFIPHLLRGGLYEADTRTAGSVTLLLQISLPCALFSNCTTILRFNGGTNTEMAPQMDYLTEVFRPILERFGASFDYRLHKRGYYPEGGGVAHFRVQPVHRLEPVTMLDSGVIQKIWGWAFVAGIVPLKTAVVMTEAATCKLSTVFPSIEIHIEPYKELDDAAVGSASGINIIAQTSTGMLFGGSALGRKGQPPSQIGINAANQVIESVNAGACVDDHCQDQIILFMALAKGVSEIKVGRITDHTKSAIHVCEILTKAQFTITNVSPTINIIRCVGIGLQNCNLP